ncbi:MAG: riboflavin synthase [bacterium]
MFTGLIEEQGKIAGIMRMSGGIEISVKTDTGFISGVSIGDSVSIDGCCLTCEEKSADSFKVRALFSSVQKTIIKEYVKNSVVNLERAMRSDSRYGGHFVSGHVDTTGSIVSSVKGMQEMNLRIEVPGKYGKYLIENDSIAVNGISLTIKSVFGNEFTLDIIPETIKKTNLFILRAGDNVNVEINHITKSVYEFINRR